MPVGMRDCTPQPWTARLHLGSRRHLTELRCKRIPFSIGFPDIASHALRDGIQPADSIEHRARDDSARVLFERRTARRIEGIDGANKTDAAFADQILEVAAGHHPANAPSDLLNESEERANLRLARLGLHSLAKESEGGGEAGGQVSSRAAGRGPARGD